MSKSAYTDDSMGESEKRLVAVDLFCGAGGKTNGFLSAGVEVVAGVDIDPTCKYAYEHNNRPARFIQKSVSDLTAKEVAGLYPKNCTRILIGCAPCQPFSTYSYRYQGSGSRKRRTDRRWDLLYSFGDLIESVNPEIITAENVPQLALQGHKVYLEFIKTLRDLGYEVYSKVVRCAEYGVPQTRERLVILASRLGPIDLIPPTHKEGSFATVREAIGALPSITAGGQPPTTDLLHRSCRLSKLNMKRVKATKEGGGWQDWPRSLRLKCHSRSTGSTYPSVYGRMSWDELAPTLTTQCYGLGNGRFGHPEQDRAMSLREAALLQTFPPDYQFVGPKERLTFKHIGKHIGNAVPVRLGWAIAESVKAHLEQVQGQRQDQADGSAA